MRNSTIKTLDAIKKVTSTLDDKKAHDTVVLDVRKVSTITDYYVICSASNTRHIKALIEECDSVLSGEGVEPYRKSGTPESFWMILDYVEFVIHVFGEEAREHYALEALWKDAPRVD